MGQLEARGCCNRSEEYGEVKLSRQETFLPQKHPVAGSTDLIKQAAALDVEVVCGETPRDPGHRARTDTTRPRTDTTTSSVSLKEYGETKESMTAMSVQNSFSGNSLVRKADGQLGRMYRSLSDLPVRETRSHERKDSLVEEMCLMEVAVEPPGFADFYSKATAKRRGGVSAEAVGAVHQHFSNWVPPSFAKTAEQWTAILLSFRECPYLAGVDRQTLEKLADAVYLQNYEAGACIYEHGEVGRTLMILISGSVDFHRIDRRNESEFSILGLCQARQKEDDRGPWLKTLRPNSAFGEYTMLWGFRREASVYAREECVLGKLKRAVFFSLITSREMHLRSIREDYLRHIPMFEVLTCEQIAAVGDIVEIVDFEDGEAVIRQGHVGTEMFIVWSGEGRATVSIGKEDAPEEEQDVQEHRRYYAGDRFGELGFLQGGAPRGATVTAVGDLQVLSLKFSAFRRVVGDLQLVQREQYMMDPRKTVADFYEPGGKMGPRGVAPAGGNGDLTKWFAVYRPTSRDAINKMLTRVAVGKGLNVKGKSSKKNHLSGFVPFLQISLNDHKDLIEDSPQDARFKVFFQSSDARENARVVLSSYLLPEYGLELGDNTEICDDERFKHKGIFGLEVPERIFMEAYVMQQDISFRVGWETGRQSEPAFMDMNLHAVRINSEPEVVLYQYDKDNPMNPQGVLIAYAEASVKPVVSDFDTFVVGSRGMHYSPIPAEQQELAIWALCRTIEILRTPKKSSWNSRWLAVLSDANDQGFIPKTPKYGFGDAVSCRLIQAVVEATKDSGAVRHGAECFNYYFPQELDSEYLIIWEGFPNKPWKYEEERGLRDFLLSRIAEGYSFPLNPVWPVRDKGWYEVYEALKANAKERSFTFDCWYPPGSGIPEKIEAIHDEMPFGFVPAKTMSYFSEHPEEEEATQFFEGDPTEILTLLSDEDLDHDELGELISHVATDVRCSTVSSLNKNSRTNSGASIGLRHRLSHNSPIAAKHRLSHHSPKRGVVKKSFRRMSSAAQELMAQSSSCLNDWTQGLNEFGHAIARPIRPQKHLSAP